MHGGGPGVERVDGEAPGVVEGVEYGFAFGVVRQQLAVLAA